MSNTITPVFDMPPEHSTFWLIAFAFATAGILLIIAWRQSRISADLRRQNARLKISLARIEGAAAEVDKLTAALDAERAVRRELEQGAAASAARLAERDNALKELRSRIDTEFRAITAQMLEQANRSFLVRANETFERHRDASLAESQKRRNALDEMINPMRESLLRYEKNLADMQAENQKSRGELLGRIGELAQSANNVRLETQRLSTALRSGTKAPGRWGEEQLRNVVETAGMSAHVDFVEQATLTDGERRKIPDMIVNLPGGRKIAVDSKVSIGAYLEACEAQGDACEALLKQHAEDLWAHVKALSLRDYAAAIRDSLDVVIMFVPGENYFAAALEARPQLFQDAFDKKILVATPTTLVAILKAASFNWRQERTAEHAVRVAELAKGLYESLQTMTGRLDDLGRALDRAVGKYNQTVNGFERRVLPRARKISEYELPGMEKSFPDLPLIETGAAALVVSSDMQAPNAELVVNADAGTDAGADKGDEE